MNSLQYLLGRNKAVHGVVLGLFSFAVMTFIPYNVDGSIIGLVKRILDVFTAFSGGVLLFTGFDILGYSYLVCHEDQDKHKSTLAQTTAYRILQLSIQAVITMLLITGSGWMTAVAFNVFWWFGGCDVLYYWMDNEPLWTGSWYWLWWTPFCLPRYLSERGKGKDHDTARGYINDFKCDSVLFQMVVGTAISVTLITIQLWRQ